MLTGLIRSIVQGAPRGVGFNVAGAAASNLTVLDKDGNSFSCGLAVLDKDGNSFTVTNAVLDKDGNSFTVA